MDIKNINVTTLQKEVVDTFLKSLEGKMGYFDMYHNYGPSDCFCTPEYIAVVMHDSNWSDARGAGGIERNNSIRVYDHNFQLLGESAQVNYRHRYDGKYDNYHNHYVEIVEVADHEGYMLVFVRTGKNTTTAIRVERKK